MSPDNRIAFVSGGPAPEYRHEDVDGDHLLITSADIPDVGPGVYFRTDPQGSSVPFAEIPALIEALTKIAAHACADSIVEAIQ